MTTYHEHNDAKGRADRLLRAAHVAQYRHVHRVLEEYDAGLEITRPMSKGAIEHALLTALAVRQRGGERYKAGQTMTREEIDTALATADAIREGRLTPGRQHLTGGYRARIGRLKSANPDIPRIAHEPRNVREAIDAIDWRKVDHEHA